MSRTSPTIVWLRRDLRLGDHAPLLAACQNGGPVIPVFIHDDSVEILGAAPKWRLGLALEDLARQFEEKGSRLILRRGKALETLQALIRETGATEVHWTRLYDPHAIVRDKTIKTVLRDMGLAVHSHSGHLLFEPWTVETKTGGFYRVYSPMWRAVKDRDVAAPQAAPTRIPAPDQWPTSDALDSWQMGAAMQRGAAVCRPYQRVGEDAALERLNWFINSTIKGYKDDRNMPALDATSGMSPHLALGEVSPRQCWHAGLRAFNEGAGGAEHWLKELVWREFAYHLMYHTPHILTENWRHEWDGFPWQEDENHPHVIAWKRGRTGVPFVDAAMREMYVTGRMHNRARMIVGSYLTKHLLFHWKIGMRWFEQCLTDWDPAANAMGWQWVAGSGPDAAPYFRVFNPESQLYKFDPDHAYPKRWIAEGWPAPSHSALSYFSAIPQCWKMSSMDSYPDPLIDLGEGRKRALAAYQGRGF